MKVSFILQRRFALIGHALAHHLSKMDDGMEFCAFVQTRESLKMLTHQSDLKYTRLLLEEDLHKKLSGEQVDDTYLEAVEQKYGIPNLWPHLTVDRVIMHGQLVREYPYDHATLTLPEMKQRLQSTVKELEKFLDAEKPDVLVASVIGSLGSSLLYAIAKQRGIKTLNFDFARIGNRISISEDYRTLTETTRAFTEIRSGRISPQLAEASSFLKTFREKPSSYHKSGQPSFNNQTSRKGNFRFLAPRRLINSVRWYTKALLRDLRNRHHRDYTDVLVWWALWDNFRRKVRGTIGYSDLYTHFDEKTNFAYYPLHLEPEMAIMLLAPYYTNQIEVIRAAARALPLTMLLYVKEHPGMVGYRTRSYYKELLKIPNVRLIDPQVPGQQLSRACKLTLTVTGSGGWESLLLKKPVITFGDVFFNDAPGVERCRGYEQLPHLVKQQLERFSHDEDALTAYVAALLEESVPVDYTDLWANAQSPQEVIDDPGMKKLAAFLFKKISSSHAPTL